jgi:predicted nucleotidyltransferase
METHKLKFTRLQNEIFQLLCVKVGEDLNQRTIANLLKVSPTAVAKSIKYLEKYNLIKIKKSKTMNLTLIYLNRDNQRTITLKRVENLKQIYESRLAEFLEEKFPGCAIILFGSYCFGEDTINSDIDLAIIGGKGKQVTLTKFENVLERNININFYDLFRKINKHLKENLCNGIVLAGGIEL